MGNHVGHAPCDYVFIEKLQSGVMKNLRHGHVLLERMCYFICQRVLVESPEKLFKIEGKQSLHVDLAHRKGVFLPVDGDAEEASCGNKVIMRV